MSLSLVLRRASMLTALALALTAPAALAEPIDARQQDLAHLRAGSPSPELAAARAQERYYTSYGTPTPSATVADSDDGVAYLPFALSVFGALIIGLGAGSGVQVVHSRRRHSAELAV
jgi:hypothetical protein